MSGSKTPRGGKGRVRASRPGTTPRSRSPVAELPAATPVDKVAEALRAPLPQPSVAEQLAAGPVAVPAEPTDTTLRPVASAKPTLADVVAGVMAAAPAEPVTDAFAPEPEPAIERPAPPPADITTRETAPDDQPVAPGDFATAMSLSMLDLYRQGAEANLAYWSRLFEPPSPARTPERD